MSALTPGESTDSRRVDAHVEALAKITCADDHENCGYAAWDDAPEGIREYHRGHASAILASDWLADVVAQAKAEALREAADLVGPELANEVGGHTSTYSVRGWLRKRASEATS